jgi:glutathione S-transferase
MKLLGTTSSPFVRKVRIVALEKNLPLGFIVDSPLEIGSAVPTINPLGKVPVLVRDDGTAMIDSPLIVEYLESLGEHPRLIPVGFAERLAVRQWEAIADGVVDAAVLVRMEQLRAEHERSAEWIARQQEKVERGVQFMNSELGGSEYCVGGQWTLADIALGCCIGYLEFRAPAGNWRMRFPQIVRAMAAIEERASFRATRFA